MYPVFVSIFPVPAASIVYRVQYVPGCINRTTFLNCISGGDHDCNRYHRLYWLETRPNYTLSDRFASGEWFCHWSRSITSGTCLDLFHALKAELHSLSLSTDRYSLRWGLTYDGSFISGATRKDIDDVILPTLSVAGATFILER